MCDFTGNAFCVPSLDVIISNGEADSGVGAEASGGWDSRYYASDGREAAISLTVSE